MSDPLISIATARLSADIDPFGAQLFALRDGNGRDLLWNGDPAVWNGRAPLLFPIVGALQDNQYRLGDKVYNLPRHGFARNRRFAAVETNTTSALLRLRWDAETLAVYPFPFELELHFALEDARLTVTATVKNLGNDPMPASFGFHPAFRWPLPYGRPRAGHAITFARDEAAPVRRLNALGTVLPQVFPTPVMGRTLALRDELFENDALIFDHFASHSVVYGATTDPNIRMDFPDTPTLGVWTKPGADFIAIEPWHGIADPQGYTGDFHDKPGVFCVPPGGAKICAMAITLAA